MLLILGQRKDKKPSAICYARKMLTNDKMNYTNLEEELLAPIYDLEKF